MVNPFWWAYDHARLLVVVWEPGAMFIQAWACVMLAFALLTIHLAPWRWVDRLHLRWPLVVLAYVLGGVGILIAGHAGEMVEIEQLRRLLANG